MTEHFEVASRIRPLQKLLLACTLMAGLPSCKEHKQVAAIPQAIQVMTISAATGVTDWSLVGTIKPRYETDLGFRVPGKITERLVDVGQTVSAGQVIARLDGTDYQLNLDSQEAELRAAISNREQAVAAETRYRILLKDGHVSQAALDQKVAAADEARSRFDRAMRSLDLARNQLGYTELKTDTAGVISALPVEVGQVLAIGQPAARLARLDSREAVVAVPEQMIEALKASEATIELWGGDAPIATARLRELSPQADAASRTFQARFAIEDTARIAALGRTVTLHLKRRQMEPAFGVPLSAVFNDGAAASVFVVDALGTRVRRTPVTVRSFTQDHALLHDGIKPGDRIVTLGVHMLDDAKPVRIIDQRAEVR